MHILAFNMLHQHKVCGYKGKRKLKMSITCENFVLFALYQFLFCFVNIVLENVEKSLQSDFLERFGRVTVNTAFFALAEIQTTLHLISFPNFMCKKKIHSLSDSNQAFAQSFISALMLNSTQKTLRVISKYWIRVH